MTPEDRKELRKPFDPKAVGKLPKGGVQLDFVGHAAVTDRLLAVDPAWTWEPVAFGEDGLPAYDRAGGLWIRLTVCGVSRLGYGDGPDPKQRIGDAIRNAAMRFGVALDLWSRQELEGVDPNGGDAAARPQTAEQWHAKHDPVTDTAWYEGWRVRVAEADSVGVLKGLWGEMTEQARAGHLSDADRSDAEAIATERAEEMKAVSA